MKYLNKRTGNVITVPCRIEGPDWEEITEKVVRDPSTSLGMTSKAGKTGTAGKEDEGTVRDPSTSLGMTSKAGKTNGTGEADGAGTEKAEKPAKKPTKRKTARKGAEG